MTNPTGINLSPYLNPYPVLGTLNSFTSNKVDPIPVVLLPPTSIVNNNPIPVSVVAPTPNLEIPVTGRFSYDGDGDITTGLMYPVPPPTTEYINVPPTPTVAVIVAPAPTPPPVPTPTAK